MSKLTESQERIFNEMFELFGGPLVEFNASSSGTNLNEIGRHFKSMAKYIDKHYTRK